MTATFAFSAFFLSAAMFFAIVSAAGRISAPPSNSKSEIISIISSTTSDLSGALPCKSSFFGIFLRFLLLLFARFLFAHFLFISFEEKINRARADNQNQNHHRGNEINFGVGGIRHIKSLSQDGFRGQKATREDLFVSNNGKA